jgi:hypothetical protein
MELADPEADTAFAELICADAQWLREEFDALISASFSQPPAAPPPAPPRVPPSPGPAGPPSQHRLRPRLQAVCSVVAMPGHHRQRSPPS